MAANWPKPDYSPDAFQEAAELTGQTATSAWAGSVGDTLDALTADLAAAIGDADTVEEAAETWGQRDGVVFEGTEIPVVMIDALPLGTDGNAFQVFADNGYERRLRFAVENNVMSVGSPHVDVNVRNAVLNVGDALATNSYAGTKIRLLQPTGATGNLLEVLEAASQTSKVLRITNAGALMINSRGLATRAFAINTAAGDTAGAEPWLAIDQAGKVEWGPGGGAALDVALGRAASGVVEVTGKIRQTGTPSADEDLATVGWVESYVSPASVAMVEADDGALIGTLQVALSTIAADQVPGASTLAEALTQLANHRNIYLDQEYA